MHYIKARSSIYKCSIIIILNMRECQVQDRRWPFNAIKSLAYPQLRRDYRIRSTDNNKINTYLYALCSVMRLCGSLICMQINYQPNNINLLNTLLSSQKFRT